MTLVSVAAYGGLHGVSKAAAQKWKARGLLVFKDGKVDVEASDRSLAHAGLGRFADSATKARRAPATSATEQVQTVAASEALIGELQSAAEIADEEMAPALIAFIEGLANGDVVNLIQATTIKENALAAIRMIEARKRAGEIIELAEAESVVFEMFRRQRDAWLNFPSRVGAVIAAELGIENVGRVVEVLTAHVHQQLTDLGEPDDPLGQAGPAAPDGPKGPDAAAQA